MTAKELILSFQELREENLNREIIMLDGPRYYIPCKVELLTDKKWGNKIFGKIMID